MAISAYIEPTDSPLINCWKNSVMNSRGGDGSSPSQWKQMRGCGDEPSPPLFVNQPSASRVHRFFIHKPTVLDLDDNGRFARIAFGVERRLAGHAIQVLGRRQGVADFRAVG